METQYIFYCKQSKTSPTIEREIEQDQVYIERGIVIMAKSDILQRSILCVVIRNLLRTLEYSKIKL